MIDSDAIRARIAEAREHTADERGVDWWSALANTLAADAEAPLPDHLAMREAVEEMPSVSAAHAWYHNGGAAPTNGVSMRLIVRWFMAGVGAACPILAKRTRERDEAREDATGARAAVCDFEMRAHTLALERDAAIRRAERAERELNELRAVRGDLVSMVEKVDTVADGLRARVAELESRLKRAECPICHGSGVLRGTNEYELDTTCPKVVDHG